MRRTASGPALVFAVVLAAGLVSGVATARDLSAVESSGVLRAGTTGDYKPFSFRTEAGDYRGADITAAQDLAAALGVRLELVPTTWPALNADFQADRFDIAIGGVTVLPAREAFAAFGPAMVVDGKRPIVRCGDRDRYTSIAAINQPGVRVVVNPGASNEQFARASFPQAALTVFPDNTTVFAEIAAGRQDVMVTDGVEVDHQARLHPKLCAAAVQAPFTRLEKAFMLPKDPAFVAAVQHWWATEAASGAWSRALDSAERADLEAQ